MTTTTLSAGSNNTGNTDVITKAKTLVEVKERRRKRTKEIEKDKEHCQQQ